MRSRSVILAALAALCMTAPSARAGLLNDRIAASWRAPDLMTVQRDLGTRTVAPTATFSIQDVLPETISDTRISVTSDVNPFAFTPRVFNGFRFENLTDSFGAVTLDTAATTVAGFGADRIGLSGNVLTLNLQGLNVFSGQFIVLNVGGDPVAVPAHAGLALFGLGLLGLAAVRRRSA